MFLNTKYRTNEPEIMDDFALEGELLRDALDKIAKINQILGGNKLTLQGVQKLMQSITQDREFIIVDVGCGNGDMLRTLAKFANDNNVNYKLIGIDANQFTINHAEKLSLNYPTISYLCEDIFDTAFKNINCDIVLCTLTLHHFKEDQINYLVPLFYKQAQIGVVINDLHRNIIAYRAFQLICFIFGLNKMSKEDGLISILRGFKKQELIEFSEKNKLENYTLNWKWAFRYQWILKKIE